jgi:hypothetical protein
MHSIKVQVGDQVEKGAVIASHSVFFGLFRAEVKAPIAGRVELISELTGTLMLRSPPTNIECTAFITGRVSRIRDNLAATIQARCSLVQGVFGVGGERLGIIRTISSEELSRSIPLDHDLAGAVIISRGPPSLEDLAEASRRKISGWIAGSIDDGVIETFAKRRIGVAITGDEDVPFSLFVTEGFGTIPMNDEAWSVFVRNEGRPVSMTGVTQVRAGAIRPEAIIPLPDQSSLHSTAAQEARTGLMVGKMVRLIRHPYFGKVGLITDLPPTPREIPSGASARIAVVRFEDGSTVEIPRANIELLGGSGSDAERG